MDLYQRINQEDLVRKSMLEAVFLELKGGENKLTREFDSGEI
jgi:hypothetical protein